MSRTLKEIDKDIKECKEALAGGRYPSIERALRNLRIERLELLVADLVEKYNEKNV